MKTLLALLLSTTLFTACATTDPATTETAEAMGPVNTTCPIMGGEVDPEAATVMYDGHKIGFCCNGCESKWEAWSDEQKAEFVSTALSNQ